MEGLVMGSRYVMTWDTRDLQIHIANRSGSVDPGAVAYFCSKSGKPISDVVQILNRDSGLKGLCGSNDMREVVKMGQDGNEKVNFI